MSSPLLEIIKSHPEAFMVNRASLEKDGTKIGAGRMGRKEPTVDELKALLAQVVKIFEASPS